MKSLLLFAALAAPAFAAIAPDTLAGKIYRDYSRSLLGHFANERTLVFEADGHFVFLKSAKTDPQSIATRSGDFRVSLAPPLPDGTYHYTRTGENTGTIALAYSHGTQGEITLNFLSASGGTLSPATGPADFSEFSLSDVRAAADAPLANFSLRGRVAPGQPFIAGFIIPGTSEREVLIRAVGPGLAAFGVNTPWAAPDFQIFRGTTPAVLKEAHDVGPNTGALEKITRYMGAFPLSANGHDTADVLRLSPGAYTLVCHPPAGDPGGEMLLELYLLP